jgi:hypothetical protein
MPVVEGFQIFAGIPSGLARIFESLMRQQVGTIQRTKSLNSGENQMRKIRILN